MRRWVMIAGLSLSMLGGGRALADGDNGGQVTPKPAPQPVPIRRDAPEKMHDPRRPEPPPPVREAKPAAENKGSESVNEPKLKPPPIRRVKSTKPKDPRHPEPPPPESKAKP